MTCVTKAALMRHHTIAQFPRMLCLVLKNLGLGHPCHSRRLEILTAERCFAPHGVSSGNAVASGRSNCASATSE